MLDSLINKHIPSTNNVITPLQYDMNDYEPISIVSDSTDNIYFKLLSNENAYWLIYSILFNKYFVFFWISILSIIFAISRILNLVFGIDKYIILIQCIFFSIGLIISILYCMSLNIGIFKIIIKTFDFWYKFYNVIILSIATVINK